MQGLLLLYRTPVKVVDELLGHLQHTSEQQETIAAAVIVLAAHARITTVSV